MAISGISRPESDLPTQPKDETVILAAGIFASRRDNLGLRAGESIIVQTARSGQIKALVMGVEEDGLIAVRLSRWGSTVTVEQSEILRRVAS